MKKKITKKIVAMIAVITLIFINFASSVKAEFVNEFTMHKTNSAAYPADGDTAKQRGQTYKYNENGPVYCTAYDAFLDADSNITCTLNDDWSEPVRAGVAYIINAFNFQVPDPDNITSNQLKKNLQITLTINQFLYEKNGQSSDNLVYYFNNEKEPNLFLTDESKTILAGARTEFDKISSMVQDGKIDTKVEIEQIGTYDAEYDQNDPAPTVEYHITTSKVNPAYLKVIANKGSKGLPEGITIKVYKAPTQGNYVQVGTLTSSTNESVGIISDGDNNTLNDLYVKLEMVDQRTDKSERIDIRPYVTAYGAFKYYVARNYSTSPNKQTVTPAHTEEIIYDSHDKITMPVKSPAIPDYPNLEIVKVDENGNTIIDNPAKFSISHASYDKNTTTENDIIVTRANVRDTGILKYKNIEDGLYCVEEVWAPSGYLLDNTKHCFKVKIEGNSIVFNKVNSNDNIEISNDNKTITVKIKNTKNRITLGKINSAKSKTKYVAGATLKLTTEKNINAEPVNFNNETLQWTTTTEPKVLVGLPKGTYYLYEISAPSGYVLNKKPTVVFVNLTDTEPKIYTIDDSKTKIKIRKVDENKQLLKGAVLQITKLDGNIVAGPWTTGENGETDHIITGLEVNEKYYLEELSAPKGYTVTSKTKFKLSPTGNLIILDGEEAEGNTVVISNKKDTPKEDTPKKPTTEIIITVEDKPKVYLSKQDITNKGTELPGATLMLKDQNGNEILTWKSSNEPRLFEDLGQGTYTLTEITAPEGYAVAESITFTIDENGNISGDTVMYDTPLANVPSTSAFQSLLFITIGIVLVGSGVGLYIYGIKKKKEI